MTMHNAEAEGLTCREAIRLFGEYLELSLTPDRLAELRDRAAKHGLIFFSAPFPQLLSG